MRKFFFKYLIQDNLLCRYLKICSSIVYPMKMRDLVTLCLIKLMPSYSDQTNYCILLSLHSLARNINPMLVTLSAFSTKFLGSCRLFE